MEKLDLTIKGVAPPRRDRTAIAPGARLRAMIVPGALRARLRRWLSLPPSPGRDLAPLFAADGPFGRYGGPAAWLDGQARILAANSPGRELVRALAQGAAGDLARAVAEALAAGREAAPARVAAGDGTWLEFTVLPCGGADGGRAESALVIGRDETLSHNLESALAESRQRYKDLVEVSSDFAWEIGADGRFSFVSPRGALGYAAEELVGRDPRFLLFDPPARSPFSASVRQEEVTLWARRADGGAACVLLSSTPLVAEDGTWRGVRGVWRDITAAYERDAALARARAREQLLFHIVRQIRDQAVPQEMMNAAAAAFAKGMGACACRIYRRAGAALAVAADFGAVAALAPAPVSALLAGREICEDRREGWRILAAATRHRREVNGAVALWRDPEGRDWDEDDLSLLAGVAGQIGIAIEQLANHEALERMSRTDALTGLLNRRVFLEELGRRLAQAERTRRPGALCYLDLDDFKRLNDGHGHEAGDRALRALARLLQESSRANDLVARLGGDEFALWLEEAGAEAAAGKARAIVAQAAGLGESAGEVGERLGLSIGIAIHAPGTGEGADALMARADQAMYVAKRTGRGGVMLAPPPESPARPRRRGRGA